MKRKDIPEEYNWEAGKIRHMELKMSPDEYGFWHHLPEERDIYAIIRYHRKPDPVTGIGPILELEWEET